MSSFELTWGKDSYGLKEFAEKFRHKLPVMVKVVQGYCGVDEAKYTFSMEETYHISHINSQRRIITKDSTGRMLSIPEDYPVKFSKKGTGTEPMRFQDMFQNQPFRSGISVIPAETKLSFFIAADSKMKTGIDSLELVDRYSDEYLVGNPVISGEMYDSSVSIPLFIGIKLVVAVGLKTNDAAKFTNLLQKYKSQSVEYKNHLVPGYPEIMLYENDEDLGGEYALLEPKTYISCAELEALRKMYEPLKKTTGSITEETNERGENTYVEVDYNRQSFLKPKPPPKPTTQSKTSVERRVFQTLEEVPNDLHGVTTEGVADCLRLIGLEKHVDKFTENDVDGDLLLELDNTILVEDFQMSKLEAKKVHMFTHQGWRPKKN